jgi:hypothetical protein
MEKLVLANKSRMNGENTENLQENNHHHTQISAHQLE